MLSFHTTWKLSTYKINVLIPINLLNFYISLINVVQNNGAVGKSFESIRTETMGGIDEET